jgi:excisionase family DNA binding protein
MIDVNREELLTFDEAASVMKVTWKTIYMWSKRAGKRLESVKLGGKRLTSREALQRFAEQDDSDAHPVGAVIPPAGPQSDYERSLQTLEERHGSF